MIVTRLTTHDPRVQPSQHCPLERLVGNLQIEGVAHGDGSLQRAIRPFFANILPKASAEHQVAIRTMLTLVMMFAPSEKPMPKSGRLGNVCLAQFMTYLER